MGLPVTAHVVPPSGSRGVGVVQPAPATTAKAGPVATAPSPAQSPVQQPAQSYRTPSSYSVTGGFGMRDPSASEYAYGANAGQLKTPGATEAFNPKQAYAEGFGRSAQGQLYASQQPGLAQPAGIESYASDPRGYGRAFGGTASAQNYAGGQQALGAPSAAERFAGAQTIDREMGSTAAGQYWAGLQGQGPTVPQDMSAYYDRAREKGSAQMDRAAAARGMFGSSAALDQQRELASDIGASQAQAEADYAIKSALAQNDIMGGASQAADTAGLARYNTLLGASQAADEGLRGRLGMAGQQASAADEAGLASYMGQANVQNLAAGSSLDRVRAAQQGAQGADAAALGYAGFGLEGARSADQAKLDRLGLLGQGASAADAGRLGRSSQYADQIGGATENALGLVGGSYADLFGTDQGYMDQAGQLALGSGAQNLAGVQGQQAATGAQGAQLVQTGANSDATARQILMSSGGK